ncbi:MAG TPA: hypothetical protein VKR99_07595 [Candidatus Eremiobacteraceae bacterium]|nr:hypothetical protein [Candidatus Eremiobacteraceae bacterium]
MSPQGLWGQFSAMLKSFAFAALAIVLICCGSAARAADYQGRMVDGHVFGATVYGPAGAEPAVVAFTRDEARVQLLDGESLIVILYSRTLDDIHFVSGKSMDGRFYRLDLNETAWLYGSAMDPFFMPNAPNSIGAPPVIMGGGHHGGHHGG